MAQKRNAGGSSLRVLLMLLGSVILLTACSDGGNWHEKLAIEVETPEGIKRAHSVLAMKKWVNTGFFGAMDQHRAQTRFSGEAVVLEVSPGRYLFVLLTNFSSLSRMTFHYSQGYPRDFVRWTKAMEDLRARRDVPRNNYPLMVTFADIADPATVTRVDPDNLAATFGPGHALKSLTLEVTDEPVTEGRVEKVLGWIHSIKGRLKPTQKQFEKDLTAEEKLSARDFHRSTR